MSVVGEAYVAVKPEVDGDDFGDEIEREVEGSLSGLANIGKAAGAAAGVAVVAGAMEGIERERLGDKLAAQLDLSPEESEKAGAVAGSLYADAYGESLGQVNDAVGAVMSGIDGLNDADTEAATANALDLASAFDVDVTEAVSVVGTMIRQGLVEDAETGFDAITSAMQQVPASMREELLPIMDEYSKDFAGLGFSGEDAMGLIVSASDKGRLALDKTGDAVKEFSIRSTDMSTASTEAYDAIGLNAEDMADRILAGGDSASGAFQEVVDGLLGMEDPAERAQAAVALFGTPIEDLGVSGIPDFLEGLQGAEGGLGDFEGAADRMGDTLNDNAATKIEGFRRKIEGALAQVVEAPGVLGDAATAVAGTVSAMAPLAPAMTGVAVLFKDQLTNIGTSLASGAGSAARWAGRTVAASGRAAAGVVRGTGTMIAAGARWAAQTAAQGARAVASMAATAGRFIAQYARMAAASLANAARMAASWVIAMGPIGWAIAAVVGLVALIIANWDKVVEFTRKAWEWVSAKIEAVWKWVTTTTKAAVAAVIATVAGWVEKVVSFVTDLWERWVAIATAIRDAVIRAVVTLVTTVVTTVSGWVESIVGFVTNLWTRWRDLVHTIRDAVIDAIRALVNRVVDTIAGWVESLISFVTNLKTDFVGTIRDLIGEVVGFWRELPGKIIRALGNMGSLLYNAGRNLIDGLIRGAGSLLRNIGSFFLDLVPGWIRGPFEKALGISSPSKVFAGYGGDIMDGLGDGIVDRSATAMKALRRVAGDLQTVPFDLGMPSVAVGAGQPGGVAGQARDAAATGPLVGGDINIYTVDAKRSGDEVLRSLRERAYLNAPLTPGSR